MNKLRWIVKAAEASVQKTGDGFQGFVAMIILVMMASVALAVVMRYIFHAPLAWTFEAVGYMLVAITFLALAGVQARGQHVRVEFLLVRLSDRWRNVFGVVTILCALFFFSLVTWASWEYAVKALHFGLVSEEQGFPLFPPRLLVPVGCFVMCLQLLINLRQHIGFLSRRDLTPGQQKQSS